VEEAVSIGSLVRLLDFEGGDAHLVEVTLADSSPAKGKALSELAVPRDASVVAVVRGARVLIPREDIVVQVGDEVVALVTGDSESQVRDLFVSP